MKIVPMGILLIAVVSYTFHTTVPSVIVVVPDTIEAGQAGSESPVVPAVLHFRIYPYLPGYKTVSPALYSANPTRNATSLTSALPFSALDSPFTVAISGAVASYIVHTAVPSVNVVVPDVIDAGHDGADAADVPAVVHTNTNPALSGYSTLSPAAYAVEFWRTGTGDEPPPLKLPTEFSPTWQSTHVRTLFTLTHL